MLPLRGSTAYGLLPLLVLLVAYLYGRYRGGGTDSDLLAEPRMNDVLEGLLRAESQVVLSPEARVAVGLGSCLDMFAEGVRVLDGAGAHPPAEPSHTEHIRDLDGVEKIVAYFFRHGAAAERFVDNMTLFRTFTDAARSIDKTQYRMGGNAPVMAARFKQEGCSVVLGAQMSSELMKQVHDDIKVVGSMMDEDDIHLVLEYDKGERWGKYTAPRANRFILHSDANNPTLSALEAFATEIEHFSPDLLVLGGLQMMDNFPFKEGQRSERLHELSGVLSELPRDMNIHFEMASFAEESCLRDVIEHVVYYSDSLGMNEQELPNIHSILTNGTVTLISDPYPRVATTLDQMRALYRILRQTPSVGGKRKLTRLHVHTLAFQAIMTTKGSSWKNTMSAAAKASLTANRHTCGSPSISTDKAKIIMDESFSRTREQGSDRVPFDSKRPVSCWEEDDFEICVAPVLVCTKVVQTAGGGDNISSAGLVLQI